LAVGASFLSRSRAVDGCVAETFDRQRHGEQQMIRRSVQDIVTDYYDKGDRIVVIRDMDNGKFIAIRVAENGARSVLRRSSNFTNVTEAMKWASSVDRWIDRPLTPLIAGLLDSDGDLLAGSNLPRTDNLGLGRFVGKR
jgi:hypothetical protein